MDLFISEDFQKYTCKNTRVFQKYTCFQIHVFSNTRVFQIHVFSKIYVFQIPLKRNRSKLCPSLCVTLPTVNVWDLQL